MLCCQAAKLSATMVRSRVLVWAALLPQVLTLAPPRLYFDLKTNAASLGRIEVELAAFDNLPRLVENLRLIATNERAPRCSFDGSRFRHAPQGPQYKWSHEFEGAGNRPAIEPSLLKADAAPSCRHDVFGGSYYGYRWNDDDVLLTTPRVGPGAHKARFSFVRVKSSPPAWQERLLVNSYVLGVCAPGADEVLQRLCELPADAEPRVERAGLLDVADDCLVPAPEDARRRRPTSAVRRRRDRNTQVEIEEDCLWDVEQEAEWRERRFLQVGGCVERQRGPPRHAIEQTPRRPMVPAQVEKEGFRDPARGNSGTVR